MNPAQDRIGTIHGAEDVQCREVGFTDIITCQDLRIVYEQPSWKVIPEKLLPLIFRCREPESVSDGCDENRHQGDGRESTSSAEQDVYREEFRIGK